MLYLSVKVNKAKVRAMIKRMHQDAKNRNSMLVRLLAQQIHAQTTYMLKSGEVEPPISGMGSMIRAIIGYGGDDPLHMTSALIDGLKVQRTANLIEGEAWFVGYPFGTPYTAKKMGTGQPRIVELAWLAKHHEASHSIRVTNKMRTYLNANLAGTGFFVKPTTTFLHVDARPFISKQIDSVLSEANVASTAAFVWSGAAASAGSAEVME